MANPSPNQSGLKPFKNIEGGKGESKQLSLRIPTDIAEMLDKIGDRASWVRAAIREKAEREGLI